jgi:hypothetical protein
MNTEVQTKLYMFTAWVLIQDRDRSVVCRTNLITVKSKRKTNWLITLYSSPCFLQESKICNLPNKVTVYKGKFWRKPMSVIYKTLDTSLHMLSLYNLVFQIFFIGQSCISFLLFRLFLITEFVKNDKLYNTLGRKCDILIDINKLTNVRKT